MVVMYCILLAENAILANVVSHHAARFFTQAFFKVIVTNMAHFFICELSRPK